MGEDGMIEQCVQVFGGGTRAEITAEMGTHTRFQAGVQAAPREPLADARWARQD